MARSGRRDPGARFGALAATALVVASVIGTGVFTTSGLLLETLPSPLAVLLAWGRFAAGVISIVVGFAAPLAASALAFGHYASAALPSIQPGPAAVAVVVLFTGVVQLAHVAAERVRGPGAARAVSGLIALTLASSVGALRLAGPRVADEMGRDHRSLGLLARRTRRGAPAAALALQAVLALGMIATASFGALLGYIGFTLSICAGLTVLGVFVLRVREPQLERPYRTWGYPVTPLLFLALSTWMVAHAFVERPGSSLAGAGTIALSWLAYLVVARGGAAQVQLLVD